MSSENNNENKKCECQREENRNFGVFCEWQAIGLVSSLVLFCFAYILQDAEWTKSGEGVRMVMHAIAALTAVYCIYFTFAGAAVIGTQYLFESWLIIINMEFKVRKVLVFIERVLLTVLRPAFSVCLYIQFCYGWESLQASEMHRGIQEDQLAVDIMFALIMGFELLLRLSDKACIVPVNLSKKKVIRDHENLVNNYYGGAIYGFIIEMFTPLVIVAYNYFVFWLMFTMIQH